MDRRDVLTISGSLALATMLAGCAGDSPGSDTDSDAAADDGDMSSDLDLREANVVGVEFEERDGAYRFDVTLHHDDDGEEGYANWWQVETLDGTQLGRRVLTHPHSRQPFTRSDTIEIPADVTCVVVRGHDQTHGYGGRAVVVNLDSGAQNAIRQGSDRQSVTETECP
ncbi:MAG: twin-arginine translocation signal domain-containing protein [Haloarculaceae archaeon]